MTVETPSVRMKYTGKGFVTAHGGGTRRYRAGPSSRYADVHPKDVRALKKTGQWIEVNSPFPELRYLTENEIEALQTLADMLPPCPHVVNIGAGNGCSALALLLARDDLNLHTVDRQAESAPTGSLEAESETLARAGLGNSERHEQIEGDSKLIGSLWLDMRRPLLDMVFVDGDHSYEGCKGDILEWLPHIKHNGIMALHDCEQELKTWDGTWHAVNEVLVPRYEKILHVDNLAAYRIVKE